jgi:Neuraminidase (sialidase)
MHRSKRISPVFVAAVATALFASGTSAAATVSPITLVSGPSPYANCTVGAGTGKTIYVNAEVEPQVSINPTNANNIVAAWQQDRWSNGGAHGLVAGFSFNGGKTWSETTLPFSECAPGGLNYERASDPWVSFGPDGTLYTNAISFNRSNNQNAVAAATSTDGGKTWGNLVTLVAYNTNGGQFSTDKNSVTADPVKAGVAYSVWDTLVSATDNPDDNPHTHAFTGPAYLSKTTDGGKTWSAPQVIVNTAQNQQTIGNVIVVDPRDNGTGNSLGTLYDFFDWILAPNSFGSVGQSDSFNVAFAKSTDGGTHWSAPQLVNRITTVFVKDPNTGAIIRTGDIIPEVAINAITGQLYAVWQDSRFNNTSGNSIFGTYDEVAFATSTDGGVTWTSPIRVNTPTGKPAFTPTVRSNSNGTIAVTYYDFRNLQANNTTTLPTDYWVTFSTNGGASFGGEAHVTGPFDMLTAPFASGFFVGDYEGLASSGLTFRPVFVAANSGNTSNRTDVFTAGVTP